MSKIVIIYSTTDGHTREICYRLLEIIEKNNNIVNLKEEKKNSFEVDETSIFYQMLLYHDLYKNRRDILRKYYGCLETYKI